MNKKWSQSIKEKRLRWFGHLMRLPEDTNARRALNEWLRRSKNSLKEKQNVGQNWNKIMNILYS